MQKVQNFEDNQEEYEKKIKEFREKEMESIIKIKHLKSSVLSESVTAHVYSGLFAHDIAEEPIQILLKKNM